MRRIMFLPVLVVILLGTSGVYAITHVRIQGYNNSNSPRVEIQCGSGLFYGRRQPVDSGKREQLKFGPAGVSTIVAGAGDAVLVLGTITIACHAFDDTRRADASTTVRINSNLSQITTVNLTARYYFAVSGRPQLIITRD